VGKERALVADLVRARAQEYRAVIADAEAALREDPPALRRTLARLRRELHRIRQRDYFPPPERAAAKEAVAGLADMARRVSVELGGQR
jgi:hypothetical protein